MDVKSPITNANDYVSHSLERPIKNKVEINTKIQVVTASNRKNYGRSKKEEKYWNQFAQVYREQSGIDDFAQILSGRSRISSSAGVTKVKSKSKADPDSRNPKLQEKYNWSNGHV